MTKMKNTALKDSIIKQISQTGPISLAEYMRLCLLHPEHGYYQQETVFGQQGDFTTSPEISQMFGEILAVFIINRWQELGKPSPFSLVEIGPGRGTLMADMLRILKQFPDCYQACSVFFIEAGDRRKKEQKNAVPNAVWYKDLSQIPQQPSFFVANEFFDALPIHQFQFDGKSWAEIFVGLSQTDPNKLAYVKGPPSTKLALKSGQLPPAKAGDIIEVCPEGLSWAHDIAAHIAKYSGGALWIDYGYSQPAYGDSFQALYKHEYCSPLDHIGKADLTAHVNFASLLDQALSVGQKHHASVSAYGPIEQGQFLMGLGMGARAEYLAKGKPEAEQQAILQALIRLTSPQEMGQLFKAAYIESTGSDETTNKKREKLAPPPCFLPYSPFIKSV